MNEFEDNGTVEVVYPKEYILQILVTLALGLWIGFVIGSGIAMGYLQDIEKFRPIIKGNLTIVQSTYSSPVSVTGVSIQYSGPGPAIRIIESSHL